MPKLTLSIVVILLVGLILSTLWINRVSWLGLDVYRVESVSMQPTLKPNDLLLVSFRAYQKTAPALNDIIIFQSPLDDSRLLVKRIVHVPGDSFSYIATETGLNEQNILQTIRRKNEMSRINGYFVQGDNAEHSTDSRKFGVIPLDRILAKVLFVWSF